MKIVILMNRERFKKLVDIGEVIDYEEGKTSAIMSIASKFMVDEDNNYLDPEIAYKTLRSLKIEEFEQVTNALKKDVNETAVPPQNGEDSAAPLSQEQPQPPLG